MVSVGQLSVPRDNPARSKKTTAFSDALWYLYADLDLSPSTGSMGRFRGTDSWPRGEGKDQSEDRGAF